MPGGGSGTTVSKPKVPKEYKPLAGQGAALLDPSTREASMQKFLLDPSQFSEIQSTLANKAFGGDLNVMGNPTVQNYMNSIRDFSNSTLQGNEAQLRSRAALAGQTSTGGSSALQGLQQGAIQGNQLGLNQALAGPLLNLYSQAANQQMQSLGGLGQMENYPLSTAQQILSAFSGSQVSQPVPPLWASIMSNKG